MAQETLADKLRKRTQDIDKAVDAAQTGGSKPAPAAKPKPKPAEQTGTGKPSFDLEGAVRKLRAKIEAATDPKKKADLEARIKALKENQ